MTGPGPTDPTGRQAGESILLAAARLTPLLGESAAAEDLAPLQARFLPAGHRRRHARVARPARSGRRRYG
ncbi:MAG: hypothetical protein L0I76_37330 [Pseudonocardia sp.]|nr:hypothetical protein [Pseudonocardia sp.]